MSDDDYKDFENEVVEAVEAFVEFKVGQIVWGGDSAALVQARRNLREKVRQLMTDDFVVRR